MKPRGSRFTVPAYSSLWYGAPAAGRLARPSGLFSLCPLTPDLYAALERSRPVAGNVVVYPEPEPLPGSAGEAPSGQPPADVEVTTPLEAAKQRERVCLGNPMHGESRVLLDSVRPTFGSVLAGAPHSGPDRPGPGERKLVTRLDVDTGIYIHVRLAHGIRDVGDHRRRALQRDLPSTGRSRRPGDDVARVVLLRQVRDADDVVARLGAELGAAPGYRALFAGVQTRYVLLWASQAALAVEVLPCRPMDPNERKPEPCHVLTGVSDRDS